MNRKKLLAECQHSLLFLHVMNFLVQFFEQRRRKKRAEEAAGGGTSVDFRGNARPETARRRRGSAKCSLGEPDADLLGERALPDEHFLPI